MIRMALHLFGYDLRAFARNRQWQFFTLALPVLFLVIFASVFGGSGNTTAVAGGQISTLRSGRPGRLTLAIVGCPIRRGDADDGRTRAGTSQFPSRRERSR